MFLTISLGIAFTAICAGAWIGFYEIAFTGLVYVLFVYGVNVFDILKRMSRSNRHCYSSKSINENTHRDYTINWEEMTIE